MTRDLMNISILKERRKELRNHSTSSESVLWSSIKCGQLDGFKFRRQHSIGNYIVDFYCSEARLVVEIDGGIHNDILVTFNDVNRSEYIIGKGFRILRFDNDDIFSNIEGVLDQLREFLSNVER